MGFSSSSAYWFSPKEGYWCGRIGDEKIQSRSFEGHYQSIVIIDDIYEEQKFRKVVLTLKDGDTENPITIPLKFTFRLDSYFAQSFFARFEKAKLKPDEVFTVGVSGSEINEKVNFCWLKDSSGEVIKKSKDYLTAKKIVLNGRPAQDWVEFSEHVEKYVSSLTD